MKNLMIIISIVLSTTRGCDGCKKEPVPTECNGYMEYPQIMKDYFLFKDSSYWIYKDTATGALDSFWVLDYEKQSYWPYKEAGTRKCPCYEIFNYKIKRNSISKTQEIYLQSYYRNLGKEKETYNAKFILRANNSVHKNEERFTTIGYDSIWNETPVEGGYIYKLSKIEVNSVTYNDIQFLYYPNPNPYDWVRRIYYAKYIGAIKFEDEDGRVWELVNYKVKQ